jgi:hypothetical protein
MPKSAKILAVDDETNFELLIRQCFRGQIINLKTAKALNLTVPASLLPRTDEIVE